MCRDVAGGAAPNSLSLCFITLFSPSRPAVAYCDTPEGKRTIVRTNNTELAEQMTKEEFVGKTINVIEDHDFNLV